jgi:hypothetical protein
MRLLLWVLSPVLAWATVQVLGRIPVGPFLALTPARTAFGRAVSVALPIAGVLGIATVLSLSHGAWLLIAAFVVAAVVAIGCGIAYATLWWPIVLGGVLVGMGLWFAWLPHLSTRAVRIDPQSLQPPILVVGSFAVIMLAFVSSVVAIEALQALTPPERPAGHPRAGGSQLPGPPKRHRRIGPSRRRR